MTVVSIDANLKYLAISYTWGPQILKTIDITSVDYQGNNTFEVTASLEEALRYLRQNNTSVCAWADALCINQADEIEKTEQVRLMRDIYRQCASVLYGSVQLLTEATMLWKHSIELARRPSMLEY